RPSGTLLTKGQAHFAELRHGGQKALPQFGKACVIPLGGGLDHGNRAPVHVETWRSKGMRGPVAVFLRERRDGSLCRRQALGDLPFP
ncbi:hypothetical protein ABTE60_19835, partial [Acinetobacter baumannii]